MISKTKELIESSEREIERLKAEQVKNPNSAGYDLLLFSVEKMLMQLNEDLARESAAPILQES